MFLTFANVRFTLGGFKGTGSKIRMNIIFFSSFFCSSLKNCNPVAVVGTLTPPISSVTMGGGIQKCTGLGIQKHTGGAHKCTSLTDKQSDRLKDFTERCSYRGGVCL